MSCESFKTRLLNFALGAEDSALCAHVDACPDCRAELESHRALVNSIDRGVAAMVAGKPSGDFAAHVRARIEQQAHAPYPWFTGWVQITAAALALVMLVTFWMTRSAYHPPEIAKQPPPPAEFGRPPRGPQSAENVPPAFTSSHPAGLRANRPPRQPQAAANREPEVLVPRGEMAAVMQLYNANWSGKVDGASLTASATPASEQLKPWTTPALKIAPVEIVPLVDEG